MVALLAAPGPDNGILFTNAVGQRWLATTPARAARPDRGAHPGAPRRPAGGRLHGNSEVGLPFITGPVDSDRPVNHVLPAWDLLTGQHADLAVLAAERQRNRTGQGQHSPWPWPMSPSPRWPTSASWPT